jgi:exodeoxyribonuclease VII small subunit
MMADKKNEAFNLEHTLEELTKITEQISAGKVGLEESLRLYEKGMSMVNQCRAYLDAAESRIRVISQKADGLEIKEVSIGELKA